VLSTAGSDILVAPKNPIMRQLLRYNLNCADLATGLAPHMGDALRELGVTDDRLLVQPLGIPVSHFAKSRAAEPQQDDPIRIICTRSLQARYGTHRLIRAVHLLKQDGADVRLSIVGDGPERTRLIELTKSLGLEDNVHFSGFIPNYDVPQVLA